MAKFQKPNNDSPNPLSIFERLIGSWIDKLFSKNHFAVFPKGEIEKRWSEIEKMNPQLAVIEADKLVDTVLKRAGLKGESMADRLRKTEKLIPHFVYQDMWDAHKLRNRLVHEVDHLANHYESQQAIWKMKKYLLTLGVFKNE